MMSKLCFSLLVASAVAIRISVPEDKKVWTEEKFDACSRVEDSPCFIARYAFVNYDLCDYCSRGACTSHLDKNDSYGTEINVWCVPTGWRVNPQQGQQVVTSHGNATGTTNEIGPGPGAQWLNDGGEFGETDIPAPAQMKRGTQAYEAAARTVQHDGTILLDQLAVQDHFGIRALACMVAWDGSDTVTVHLRDALTRLTQPQRNQLARQLHVNSGDNFVDEVMQTAPCEGQWLMFRWDRKSSFWKFHALLPGATRKRSVKP